MRGLTLRSLTMRPVSMTACIRSTLCTAPPLRPKNNALGLILDRAMTNHEEIGLVRESRNTAPLECACRQPTPEWPRAHRRSARWCTCAETGQVSGQLEASWLAPQRRRGTGDVSQHAPIVGRSNLSQILVHVLSEEGREGRHDLHSTTGVELEQHSPTLMQRRRTAMLRSATQ